MKTAKQLQQRALFKNSWMREHRAGAIEARAKKHRRQISSWWTAHASPDARGTFILAAHARDVERQRRFSAQYAKADGEPDEAA